MPIQLIRSFWCAPLAIVLATAAAAQEKVTEHTIKLAAGSRPPAATIADMAWLAGHWTGEGLGGVAEEVWMTPGGGAMLGMYRLVREGKPVFYELVTIAEDAGSLVIRLKHFNPDMTSWEEKRQTVDFPLVAKSGNTIHFSGMTFRRDDADHLTVFLAIGDKSGGVREETFRYRRLAMPATPAW
jgi:hypothetical protein